MAKIREIQTIKIPILLTKETDHKGIDAFLLTCRPLSIYIQSFTKEQAKIDFEQALESLFKHLINSKKIIRYLKHRNLIESDTLRIAPSKEKLIELEKLEEKIREFQLKVIEHLELGEYNNAEIELETSDC